VPKEYACSEDHESLLETECDSGGRWNRTAYGWSALERFDRTHGSTGWVGISTKTWLRGVIALRNLRGRFNLALGIGSEGFIEGMVCDRRFAYRRTLIARAASPLCTALVGIPGCHPDRVPGAAGRSDEVSDESPLAP